MVRLVGHLDVQAVLVGIGVDGDGADTELARSADNTARDLSTVRDQDLLEALGVLGRDVGRGVGGDGGRSSGGRESAAVDDGGRSGDDDSSGRRDEGSRAHALDAHAAGRASDDARHGVRELVGETKRKRKGTPVREIPS